jgi:hypothetical protein
MDPALEAYRQAQAGYPAPQPPPVTASAPAPAPPPPTPAHNEADALKKSSLVFVNNNSGATASVVRPVSMTTEPALLERRATALLPNGSRLVARLQSAVSTAVKAPVVAAIEYNYEKDGEITGLRFNFYDVIVAVLDQGVLQEQIDKARRHIRTDTSISMQRRLNFGKQNKKNGHG